MMSDKRPLTKYSMKLTGIVALMIFVLTFMVYTPALKNDFVWDDYQYVCENTNIRFLDAQSLHWMLTSFHEGNWHPLTWLSHAIDYAFWGLNSFGHHLTNLLLHGINTLLVFLLSLRLMIKGREVSRMPLPSKMPGSISRQVLIVAGITALFFGLHPLHVESVAWVAERKDLLCGFFVLLSILSYLSYTSSIIRRQRWTWFTICFFLFIFALMSKPMAVTLPVILLLLDIQPLKRITLSPGKSLTVLLEKIPFFVLSIASSIITIIAQHSGGALRNLEQFNLETRLLNALRALVFYLGKMVAPINLVPFYPFTTHIHWLALPYLLSALLILAITGGCLWMVKRGNYLFFTAWSYYVVTLLPVLGVIKVGDQAVADRYTYLPSLGIFLLIGIGISWFLEKSVLVRHKVIRGGLVLAVIFIFMLLGQLTIKQIKVWHNAEILWSYVINAFPKRIPLAYCNLGDAFAKQGELDKAITEIRKALTIDPNYAEAHYLLGLTYGKKGKLDEAITEYRRALTLKSRYAEAHNNLGNVYAKKDRLDEAISEYKKALTIKPNFAKAHNNLGNVYDEKGRLDEAIAEYKKVITINPHNETAFYILGNAYARSGKLDKAISQLKKALAIKSNYAMAHNSLGTFYDKKGRLDEAIVEYKKAIAIDPDHRTAYYNLGSAFAKQGKLEEAIAEYKQALAINPRSVEVHNNIGVVYMKKGRLDEAISEYKQAIDIKPDYANAHDNLAISYYSQGNYRLAILHYDKAVELGSNINPKLLELLKPYR